MSQALHRLCMRFLPDFVQRFVPEPRVAVPCLDIESDDRLLTHVLAGSPVGVHVRNG